MLELLTKLCAIDGVSSWEDDVRAFIRTEVEPYAEEIKEDAIGNLIVRVRGKERAKQNIMLCAHMDEVGLMVTGATDDGYLKFDCTGAVDRRLLPGKAVRCGEKKVLGVLGIKAIHLTKPSERENLPRVEEMYIDIGAGSRDAALKLVPQGSACAFDTAPETFGDGFFKAKAIDDRIGCAALIKLCREGIAYDSWFVFSAQEEVGTRGAIGAAYSVKPDIALVLEGTTAVDRPDMEGAKRVGAAGEGVVLSYMDGATIYDRKTFERLRDIADRNNIPWQLKRAVAGGTDAAAIQRSRGGVTVAGLAAAVRYIHAPASVVSLRDAEDLAKLAGLFIEDMGGQINE